MHCALEEWTTGVHARGSFKFEGTRYRPLYEAHLTALYDMSNEAPDAVLVWRRMMFVECRCVVIVTRNASSHLPAGVVFRMSLG